MKVLIWSRKDGVNAWYRPDSRGYTNKRWEAGRFDREEAEEWAAACDYLDLHPDELPYEKAARNVSGKGDILPENSWQCLGCGRVYSGEGAERCARWCHHTSIQCECGETVTRKHHRICDKCSAKKAADRRTKELAESVLIDESTLVDYMVTDGNGNYWPSTGDYLEEYWDMDGDEPYAFLFVAEFTPVVADTADLCERACADHHEDIADSLILDDLKKAVAEFNQLCADKKIGSYFQVKKKVAVPEMNGGAA